MNTNSLSYYAIRIGLLCVIVVLGLVAYAPETFDLSGAWSGAKKKTEYITETETADQVVRSDKEQADSQMMLDAINQDLDAVKYIFSKNRFRTYNQQGWWPSIYAGAIEADNKEVIQYFLDEGYSCNYSNIAQGPAAFKAAITATDIVYLEMLLTSNCDTKPARFRPSLEDLIVNSNFPERLKLLTK